MTDVLARLEALYAAWGTIIPWEAPDDFPAGVEAVSARVALGHVAECIRYARYPTLDALAAEVRRRAETWGRAADGAIFEATRASRRGYALGYDQALIALAG